MQGITTLTQKGQVAIPKSIRDHFNLQPADKIHFSIKDGIIVAKPILSTKDMRGFIASNVSLSRKDERKIIRNRILKKYARST